MVRDFFGGGASQAPAQPPQAQPQTTVVNPADDADYQQYLADKKAAAAAAAESEMSPTDVFHRLIDAVGWNHTAERDAAHAAITKADTGKDAVAPTVAPQGASQDQGYVPGGMPVTNDAGNVVGTASVPPQGYGPVGAV